MTTPRPALTDILLTSLAPMIWGSTYIVTTELLPPDRPFSAAAIRALPAGILLVLLARRLPAKRDWGRMLLLSALNIGVFQALLFIAAYRLPGGLAAVVGATQPLMVMTLAWIMAQQVPPRMALLAGLLGVAGMAALLLSPATHWDSLGLLAAAVGAGCMATGTYLTRRWQPDLPLLALTGWQLLLGGLMLAPVAILADPPLPSLQLSQVLAYSYLSLAGALLAYTLWFHGLTQISPVAVSSLNLLSPITAVILGWLLLGQTITGIALLGLLLVLASVSAVQWAMAPAKAAQ
ncbi:EamA family transporter [Chitinimonas lacunae]|uniref:EamA family transporter n=1 Tax=Chitinimonas lacunae TaxID=1963018 RepID=A0ABV8MSG2_9NEIS